MKSERELKAIVAAELHDAELLDAAYEGHALPKHVKSAFETSLGRAEEARRALERLYMLERAGLRY